MSLTVRLRTQTTAVKYNVYRIPSATCVLNAPINSEEGSEQLTHYSRSYFVAALTPEDALDVVRADAAADGAALLDADAPEESSASEIPVSAFQRVTVGRKRGVCWRSGRVFFPAA